MNKIKKAFTPKSCISIILVTIALGSFLLSDKWFYYTFIPTILIYIAFALLDSLNLLAMCLPKKTNPIAKMIFVLGILVIGCSTVKATLPVMRFSELLPQSLNPTISADLTKIFAKYNIGNFEDLQEISSNSCDMEIRFAYILTQINRIEETNLNIEKRYKNLALRSKNLDKNIIKVNKRAQNLNISPLTISIPIIQTQKVELVKPYERILTWGSVINKNIETHNCSTKCAFNHIDQASINIVYEIDSIHKQQDELNSILTRFEKEFDNLEQQQRNKEQIITAKGF